MDLGVGNFVFSQGIASAIPLLKSPSYLTDPLLPKLITTTRKSLPIIILGLIRVVLVKGTEYPVTYRLFLPSKAAGAYRKAKGT
jgi:phosphatidylinositol glycan class W